MPSTIEKLTDAQIVAKCRRKPKTAGQLGTTSLRLRALERAGLLQAVGTVETGKRGRPPILFAPTEGADEV